MQDGLNGPVHEVVEGRRARQLPEGWKLGLSLGVAMDSRDRVYVFYRGTHPVVVFNRDGESWISRGTRSSRQRSLLLNTPSTWGPSSLRGINSFKV